MSWPAKVLLVFVGLIFAWMLGAWVWGGWLLLQQWYSRFVLGNPSKPAPPPIDGFGQTAADDRLFAKRFRACKKQDVAWREATPDEKQSFEAHPIVGRFGDYTIAVAEVDGRCWIVRERIWHGWPDPPEWAFFALEGGAIWAVADFDSMPRRWTLPGVAT